MTPTYVKEDPYGGYATAKGRRQYRPLRPFFGIYQDIKRRAPYYWSDIVDGFNYRVFSGTIRIYFVNLLPAIAFILDMGDRTDGFYGVNEALVSSVFGAIIFSVFSAQPLTIVGLTGLISLFNYTIYNIVKIYDVSLFPGFMVWVSIWAAIFHWLVAIFNLCDYMRFVTDFSSQSFGYYVSIVYIIKGVELLSVEFTNYGPLDGFMSTLIGLLYFATVYSLESLGRGTLMKPWVRDVVGNYAYPVSRSWSSTVLLD